MHYHVLDKLAINQIVSQPLISIVKGFMTSNGSPNPAPALALRRVGAPVAQPSAETLRLYAADWRAFAAWCRSHRANALPANAGTLSAYLLDQAPQLSRSALGRRRAAVAAMHRQNGHPAPALSRPTLAALRQAARLPAPKPSAPTRAQLRHLAARCPRDLQGLRDRALLLLRASPLEGVSRAPPLMGSQGAKPLGLAFLLTLDAEHIRFTEAGAILDPSGTTLPRGGGVLCAVRALEDWLRASTTTFGPVFRKIDRWGNVEHARLGIGAVRQIVRRHLRRAGARFRPPDDSR